MIHTHEQMRTEYKERMRGGQGTIEVTHLFDEANELKAPNRMIARMTLPPGASIGEHAHGDEEEIYYILSGVAHVTDNGKDEILHAGESMLTGNGSTHSIANRGTEPLCVLAVITLYEKG